MTHKTLEQMAQEAALEQRQALDQMNADFAEASAQMVQDRRTSELYDPKGRFIELMDNPEIQAVFKRMANK